MAGALLAAYLLDRGPLFRIGSRITGVLLIVAVYGRLASVAALDITRAAVVLLPGVFSGTTAAFLIFSPFFYYFSVLRFL